MGNSGRAGRTAEWLKDLRVTYKGCGKGSAHPVNVPWHRSRTSPGDKVGNRNNMRLFKDRIPQEHLEIWPTHRHGNVVTLR